MCTGLYYITLEINKSGVFKNTLNHFHMVRTRTTGKQTGKS